jgi:hypothetical protein
MTKEISVNKINGYLVCIKELIKIVNDLKLKKHVIEEVSNYLIYGLYKNFVKYLERLPKKEVQNYLLTLKSGDFLFFNLITKLLLVEKKRVESLESKKDVKLPYKNSRLNRYSMRIGRMILFIPHALYIFFKKNKLIKKTRSLLKKSIGKQKHFF